MQFGQRTVPVREPSSVPQIITLTAGYFVAGEFAAGSLTISFSDSELMQ